MAEQGTSRLDGLDGLNLENSLGPGLKIVGNPESLVELVS